MLRKNSLFAYILIFNLFSISYGASLSGTVKDSTQTPINGAKIVLSGLSVASFIDSATTGADGSYAFDSLSMGTYSLSLTCPAFTKKDTAIVVGNGSIVSISFLLMKLFTPARLIPE